MIKILLSLFTAVVVFASSALAQQSHLQNWYTLDAVSDTLHGISLNQAYQFLQNKKSTSVIVAVMDTGIDTTQEDLKEILWTNKKEIPGNGIDDDGNGYIDDVHGWNFLGGRDGKNLLNDSYEAVRIYHNFKDKFLEKHLLPDTMCANTKRDFALWNKALKAIEVKPEEQIGLMYLEMAYKAARKNDEVLRNELQKEEYSVADLEHLRPQTMQVRQAKFGYLTFLKVGDFDPDETNKTIFEQLDEYITDKKKAAIAKTVHPGNQRAAIVGDNYYDLNDRFYGNADVMGPAPMHGTHVSGIIAAARNNNKGINGIADNVRIMMIRALPNGDEYDKDVALGIRYAVDNGAKVINMSFGKSISPQKKWVDEAIKYAEAHDVLLVHAAGNEAENTDSVDNYPSPVIDEASQTSVYNFITVGASSDPSITGGLVADFSNYGPSTVDVFAPGVKIYSTLPGSNRYGYLKGTSMASPVVAGIAALIRSYYPQLSARQVKLIIERSVVMPDITASQRGNKNESDLSDKCKTGGVVNAYTSVKLAEVINAENKKQQPAPVPQKTTAKQ